MIHEQTDTGLGYTVDKPIVGIIRAFNRLPGLRSFCSCQEGKTTKWVWIEFNAESFKAVENLRTRLNGLAFNLSVIEGTLHGHLTFERSSSIAEIEEKLS